MIFHLAIPAYDLELSSTWYNQLGCKICRIYKTHITMDFFGHQVVLHKVDELPPEPQMYPRHFGMNMECDEFENIYEVATHRKLEFFQEVFVRHEGLPEEHESFLLRDPSNNLVEFKYYNDQMMNF